MGTRQSSDPPHAGLARGVEAGYLRFMRILVTGATGFVGRHLAERLASTVELHTTARSPGAGDRHHRLDLLDAEAVRELVRQLRPDVVVHLAALAGARARDEARLRAVNVNAAVGLAQSLWSVRPDARLLAVSTGYVHGETSEPAGADAPVRPVGAYARSKAAMEQALAALAGGQDLCIVRPFNHTGPSQPESYVVPAFITRAQQVLRGTERGLDVGDLTAVRDLADVRDLAAGLARLAVLPEVPPVVPVCSGEARSMEQVLAMVLTCVGLEPGRVQIESSGRSVLRRNVGDPSLARTLGIRCRPLGQTIQDMVRGRSTPSR